MRDLKRIADPERAIGMQRFFKTGMGQYGEGDVFMGLTVPACRAVVKTHWRDMTFDDVEQMLASKLHEVRFCSLLVLVATFADDPKRRRPVYDLYLSHTDRINNWDLVDCSADRIVGAYLHGRSTQPLDKLARSSSLWERRIAIVSTFYFIKANEFENTLRISEMLLSDSHDLIHKAVGWMLREVGKRDEKALVGFLNEHYRVMPRTALRYAVERFDSDRRQAYLKGTA